MAKRNLAHTCKGMKKDGKPCLMPPLAGSEYCRHHLSASNQKSDEDREVREYVRKRERDVARVIARIGEEAFQQAAERFHLMELECMWLMEAVTKKGIPEHVFYEVLDRHPKFEEHVEWIVETSGEKKLGSFVETFMMWRVMTLRDELKPRSVYSAAFWANRHNYESTTLTAWLEKRKWRHGPEGDEYPSFQTWLDAYHAWLNTEGKELQAATPALSDMEPAPCDEWDSFRKHLFTMAGVEATGEPISIRKASVKATAGGPISKGELVTQGKDGKVYGTGYVAPPAALADIESGKVPPFFRPIILSFRQPRPLFEEIFVQAFGLDGSYQQAMPFNPSMDNLVVHVFAGEIFTNEETGKKEYRSTGSEPDFTVGLPTTFFPHDDTETGKGLKCLINGKFFALNTGGWNGTAEDDPYVIATKRNAWMGLQWPVDATPAEDSDQGGGMPSPGPLVEEDTKSRTMLQNPGISTLFGAVVADKTEDFQPFTDGERGGLRFKTKGGNALALYNQEEVPIDLRTAEIESEAFGIWARTGVIGDLSLLDDTAWDIAALGVTAFFARTEGADIDKPFPLLFEDYYDWRSTDPRKRSEATNREIQQRIELLSDTKRAKIFTRGKLYLPDPKTKAECPDGRGDGRQLFQQHGKILAFRAIAPDLLRV